MVVYTRKLEESAFKDIEKNFKGSHDTYQPKQSHGEIMFLEGQKSVLNYMKRNYSELVDV